MIARPLSRPAAAFEAPIAFSPDRVLACGPSAAWLDAGRWAPPARRPPKPLRAPITGFIEHG